MSGLENTSLDASLIVFKLDRNSSTWTIFSIYVSSYSYKVLMHRDLYHGHTWEENVILKANTRNLESTRGTFISSRKNYRANLQWVRISHRNMCWNVWGIRTNLFTPSKHVLVAWVILEQIIGASQKIMMKECLFYLKQKSTY